MSSKSIEFIVITFYYDLAQFYMLCLSMKKYQDKQYKIKIIFNKNNGSLNGFDQFEKIIKDQLYDFDVEYIITPEEVTCVDNGWISQQILKWYLAYHSTAEWQVVLDSKNFYIRPYKISGLEKGVPGFTIPGSDVNNWSYDELDKSYNFLKNYKNEPPQRYAAMTPWIWNTSKIREMLDILWPDCVWTKLDNLPGTEWFLYLSWIGNSIRYYPRQCVTGIWGDCIFDKRLVDGIDNKDICFWTHHRFATSDESLELTKQVIKYSGIATDKEITQWQRYRESTI